MKKGFAALLALMMLLAMSVAYAQEVPSLNDFTALDADGNTQTEAIFADYDMTIVYVWSPWCLACSSDVPKFVNLVNNLPEGTNLITICDLTEDEESLVFNIVTEGNANYTTLLANDEIRKDLLNSFQMLPVAVFVDSQGNLVGEPLVVADSQGNLVKIYLDALEEHLALL